MKKDNLWSFMAFSMALVLCVGFTSCSSDDVEESQQEVTEEAKDVQVYFVYTLDTSNGSSMTRSGGDEVFNKFYEKISTGEMIPDDYELTLTETTTGLKYTFNGKWSAKNLITIRTGKYKVEGWSNASGAYIQEKCSILFDEDVDISSSSNSIILNAKYNCSLLVFDDTNISKVYYFDTNNGMSGSEKPFFDFLSYKYAFVMNTLQEKAWIGGEYTNGASFRIYANNLQFEKGKYYIYNSVTNNFTIPKMEQGE